MIDLQFAISPLKATLPNNIYTLSNIYIHAWYKLKIYSQTNK